MDENESTSGPDRPAPGLVKRPIYMRDYHGKSDATGKRWQDKGQIVVTYPYGGRTPYVDVPATNARALGQDKPRPRGGPKA
jgi:hypothetical protein